MIHTLRSGRQVDNQVSTSSDPTQAPTPSISTPPNSVDKSAEQVHKPTTPFSNRLRNNNNAQMEKISEIFNQVKINVLLLDVINKSLTMSNSLRTCAPRREKPMCQRKFF